MLTIRDLDFAYDKKPVIQDLSLELEAGKIHGIIGLNGSGKTTLFNLIYGTLIPDTGAISWKNQPIASTQVGFLETAPYFYPRITGREYLELFRLHKPAFQPEQWNDIFQLPLDHLISSYSTGMRKKLALMGILCLDRPVWLLDEPFNGLDLDASQTVRLIIREAAAKGHTILLTSHILESLTAICQSMHHLDQGSITRSFGADEIDAVGPYLEEMQAQHAQAIRKMMGSTESASD